MTLSKLANHKQHTSETIKRELFFQKAYTKGLTGLKCTPLLSYYRENPEELKLSILFLDQKGFLKARFNKPNLLRTDQLPSQTFQKTGNHAGLLLQPWPYLPNHQARPTPQQCTSKACISPHIQKPAGGRLLRQPRIGCPESHILGANSWHFLALFL